MNFNKVFFAGNLARDPELRYSGSGQAFCTFTVASNRTWKSKDGEKKEETTFCRCKAWGKTGEIIAQYLTKGNPIYVEGSLRISEYEKDGQKKSLTEINVDNFQFVGSKGKAGNSEGGKYGHGKTAQGDDVPF